MFLAWWQRVGIAYVILYCLPGPVGMLPGGDVIGEAFDAAERVVVVPAGRWLFGLTLTIFPRGSGDTTYNYVEIVVELALAVLIATAWQLARRGRPVSPRTRDHVTMLIRYVLGGTMLGYGWVKLIPTQMPAPGPERLLGAIGDMSPMGLLPPRAIRWRRGTGSWRRDTPWPASIGCPSSREPTVQADR